MSNNNCVTTERRAKGNKRSIRATEVMEYLTARTPGALMIHDGSRGDIPSDVFVRRYKLPPKVVGDVVRDGAVFSFIYHLREGWAEFKINGDDIIDMDSADFSDIVRNIWNTQLGVAADDKPTDDSISDAEILTKIGG